MSESDSDELVFLSPEEEIGGPAKDQGASPLLRRSARKRKSTSEQVDMTKGSNSKKIKR